MYSYPAPFGVYLGLLPSSVAASSLLPLRGARLRLRAVPFFLWLASPPVGSVGEVTAAGFFLSCVVRGSPRVARPLGLRGSIASKLRAPRIVVHRPSDGADEDDNPSGSSISSTSSRLNRSRWFSAMSVKIVWPLVSVHFKENKAVAAAAGPSHQVTPVWLRGRGAPQVLCRAGRSPVPLVASVGLKPTPQPRRGVT